MSSRAIHKRVSNYLCDCARLSSTEVSFICSSAPNKKIWQHLLNGEKHLVPLDAKQWDALKGLEKLKREATIYFNQEYHKAPVVLGNIHSQFWRQATYALINNDCFNYKINQLVVARRSHPSAIEIQAQLQDTRVKLSAALCLSQRLTIIMSASQAMRETCTTNTQTWRSSDGDQPAANRSRAHTNAVAPTSVSSNALRSSKRSGTLMSGTTKLFGLTIKKN